MSGSQVPLKRLIERIVRGRTVTGGFDDDGEYPWWNPTALTNRLEIGDPKRRVSKASVVSGQFPLAPAGSTAFAFIGNVGRSGLLTEPGVVNEQQVCLVPSDRCHPRFLTYVLRAFGDRLDALAYHTVVRYLPLDYLLSFPVSSWPIETQRAIADYLDTETARIDALITKKRRLIMLLGERFEAEVSARVEGEWPFAELRWCADYIADGTHGTYARVDSGHPLASAKNLRGGRVVVEEAGESYVSEQDYVEIARSCGFRPGDTLLGVIGGSIGNVARLGPTDPLAFQRSVAAVRAGPSYDGDYLFFVAHSRRFQDQMRLASNTSAQAGV